MTAGIVRGDGGRALEPGHLTHEGFALIERLDAKSLAEGCYERSPIEVNSRNNALVSPRRRKMANLTPKG